VVAQWLEKKEKKKTRKQRINAICEYPKADPFVNICEYLIIGNTFGIVIYL